MARSLKFRLRKKKDYTVYVVKTKVLISCVATTADDYIYSLPCKQGEFTFQKLRMIRIIVSLVSKGSFLFLFWLWFNIPVNNFSVMLSKATYSWVLPVFWGVNVSCSRKQHTDPAEDQTRVSRSGVRRSNH